MITESQILKHIRSRRYSPATADEIARQFAIPLDERDRFYDLVRELEEAGELVEVKHRQLADPDKVDLMVGKLLVNPRGFGFIKPVRGRDGEDVHVMAENMSSAMHGDLVVARVPPAARREERGRGRGRRRAPSASVEVKIVSILKRARTEIVGTLRREEHVYFVIPDDPHLFRDVVVAPEDIGGARPDDKVAVRITVWPTRHINPAGEIVKIFGPRGQLEAERDSVVHEFSLRKEFPPEVLDALATLPEEVRPEDLTGREDLTGETIFTIDPEDARDFDDAVSLHRDGEEWELGVHIADVSHYVAADEPVDREGRARGTSVYLPGQVIPMLPEKLSNNLCSLKPHVVRLTKTVHMRFDAEGHALHARVFSSFIRSVHRFNYGEVQAALTAERPASVPEALAEKLLEMHRLAERLRARRREAGMLELALPEAHILTDAEGRTTGVELRRADESHRLIEQFMLAANEAVANHLLRHHLPYISRAHDEPEIKAIEEFRDVARALGYSVPSPGTRQQLQKFLLRLEGKPEETVLNYLLLRSMKMATYEAADLPHYAIGAAHYLHFTSPIRRYPDLLVHRILQEEWRGALRDPQRRAYWNDGLPVWTQHASDAEHRAESAERVINNRRLLDFVAQKGESMPALITAVENFGLRVQMREYLLDGIIRMSALADGYYRVDRRRGALVGPGRKEYRIGQTIAVRVLRYNEFKHLIEFEPAHPARR